MTRFTNEMTVAEIAGALFDFAKDVHLYYGRDGEPNWKTVPLITLSNQTLAIEAKQTRQPALLSNHRRLQIETLLTPGPTLLMDPLQTLLRDTPPLSNDRTGLCFEVSSNISDNAALALSLDGVRIWNGVERDAFIEALTIFVRIHENMDMAPRLSAFRLDGESMGMSANSQVHADTPENALLRFAACSSGIRSALREGKDVRCIPAAPLDHERLVAMMDSVVRERPSPSKLWLTC